MYVDEELSAQQRAAVELFAVQNPDLAPELNMLLQTKLPVNDFVYFNEKNTLLQKTDDISLDNFEETILLYIDNELTDEKKVAVEKFVLQHPELQNDFTLLKQTVLPQETVVFENKAALLRKEERRVVPLFMRYAAAAAIAGIAVLVWWMQGNHVANTQTASTKTVAPKGKVAVAKAPVKKENTLSIQPIPQKQNPKDETASVNKVAANPKTVVTPAAKQQEKILQPVTTEDAVVAVTTFDNNPNNQRNTTKLQDPKDNTTAATVTSNNDRDNYSAVSFDNDNKETAGTGTKNNYAKTAVYKELDTDEDNNRGSLYVGSIEINKNKVRGFMKKVGGLFAGKSKTAMANEDGKIQVANLELNTN